MPDAGSVAETCQLAILPIGNSDYVICNSQQNGYQLLRPADAENPPPAPTFPPITAPDLPDTSLTTPDDATPVASASEDTRMVVGSDATGGSQITGTPPLDATYAPAWTVPSQQNTNRSDSTIFTDTVLVPGVADYAQGTLPLMAYDLSTGALRWSIDIRAVAPFVATDQGVVTFIPDPGGDGTFHLARLDLHTGAVLMESPATLDATGETIAAQMLVTGRTIVTSDMHGLITAVDFETGDLLWVNLFDRDLAPGLDPAFTGTAGQPGDLRAATPVQIVTDGSTLYVTDNVTGKLSALDLASGQMRWQKNPLDLFSPAELNLLSTVATPRGPLLNQIRRETVGGGPVLSLTLFDAQTGTKLWQRDGIEGTYEPLALSDHDTIYIVATTRQAPNYDQYAKSDDPYGTTEISLADGATVWFSDVSVNIGGLIYYPGDDLLLANIMSGVPGQIENPWEMGGIDGSSHQRVLPVQESLSDCTRLSLSWNSDGSVLCTTKTGDVEIRRPQT